LPRAAPQQDPNTRKNAATVEDRAHCSDTSKPPTQVA
jgi:hypothetical protein